MDNLEDCRHCDGIGCISCLPKPAHIDTTAPEVIRAEDQVRPQEPDPNECLCDEYGAEICWLHKTKCLECGQKLPTFDPTPSPIDTTQGDEKVRPESQIGAQFGLSVKQTDAFLATLLTHGFELTQPKPAPQAEAQESAEEYVSVYETLGAMLDEKDAEIACLISRALTAEGKLAELTRNRETSYKHLVSSHVFPSRPGGYEEFYKREEVDPFMNAQQAKIDALEQRVVELENLFGLPDENDPLCARLVNSGTFDPEVQRARSGGSIGDWMRRAETAESRVAELEEKLRNTQCALAEMDEDYCAGLCANDYMQAAREKRLKEEKLREGK